ncbi:MAG TPA: maltose acetyltransferase domain-containing protein [Thermoleophilia bacterium]|nr:maltose acetyltransferase domain-containing protein [Thermoleophilia bacterium]
MRPKGRSEWDKMVSGELYDPRDPHLTARRMRARELLRHYNGSTEAERERGRRDRILRQLLGLAGGRSLD